MPIEHPDPIWVLDSESLNHYCQQWLELDAIALDTEFIRTDTFYPIPGLIQVGTGDRVFLIDPLSVQDWASFGRVLQSESVVKVLHACGEDLEVFNILTGCRPVALLDTQLAAAYAGLGHSLSYQNLLKALLEVDLPKDATRSDWLQRPLTEAQISYATLDVVHLLEAYELLLEELKGKPQLQWLKEDCYTLLSSPLFPVPSEIWKDVKRAWQLQPQQLAVLQKICEYRELEARKCNTPRNRIIAKGSLWPIARYMPDNIRSLSSIQDMRPKTLRKYGEIILNLVKQAKESPEADYPQPLPAPLPKATRDYGKLIKAWVTHKSDELNVPAELLFPGKMSNALLRQWQNSGRFSMPESIKGWRQWEIAEPLILAMKEYKEDQR
ncbi:ribonuclease D [Endozoicomonas sp. 8E]|uniref:ribonuclease D n=1 Tax=Endozoicomonas sp. 8E TaxID=3035692 RepID=UPI002938F456|nr:ribonuclease D [Endozoicomonas sp. 8E]WOG29533.1 ribonuclease D [Endozoicomonas sp. 8E]